MWRQQTCTPPWWPEPSSGRREGRERRERRERRGRRERREREERREMRDRRKLEDYFPISLSLLSHLPQSGKHGVKPFPEVPVCYGGEYLVHGGVVK